VGYPREFGDADSASQVSGSPNSFTTIRGGSQHVSCCCPGYAIFDNPTMPIIGPGETATTPTRAAHRQRQAAVDKVVEMGVATATASASAGHSYGGFMTANPAGALAAVPCRLCARAAPITAR